ncbi:MAG: undecaprenyl-diphosphate phosphatase [Clostridiales bacterium]|nr:undecaprenyl-diphosphate phosphatase [Clostridiales bacterium]
MIFEILKTVILGIIEGITEWLPISSTGHLILAQEFIKLNMTDEFCEMFDVVIQLGAILAVVVVFFDKLNPFSPKKTESEKTDTYALWIKVIIACLPAAVIGLLFDDLLDTYLYNSTVVALMLIIYGIIFIVVETVKGGKRPKFRSLESLPLSTAFAIGLFQVLALVPGTSRSGATIIGGLLIGCSRSVAAEFTFFLAIPVMFGASLLKLVKFGLAFTGSEIIILLVGMVVSFGVSILAIKFLLSYIKGNDFKVFGWYRIVLGVVVLLYFALIK